MEKKDITAISGKTKDIAFDSLMDNVSREIVQTIKSKDLTVRQAIVALDMSRSLLMDSKVI